MKFSSWRATLHLGVLLLLTNFVAGRYLEKHKRATHSRPSDEEITTFEKRSEKHGEMEIQGTKFVSMGCWKDAWDRAVTPLEGRHYLLMDPNYKTRRHALYKCARAAHDNQMKVFGIENGGQCMGSVNGDKVYRKYGPAKGCKANGKGGPWSLQVYRFTAFPAKVVDGNYGMWSQWTSCSKTCGKGTQTRMRKCSDPAPANGGEDCRRLGPSVESSLCNVNRCNDRISLGEPEFTNIPSQVTTDKNNVDGNEHKPVTYQGGIQAVVTNQQPRNGEHSDRKLTPFSNGIASMSYNPRVGKLQFNTEQHEKNTGQNIQPVVMATESNNKKQQSDGIDATSTSTIVKQSKGFVQEKVNAKTSGNPVKVGELNSQTTNNKNIEEELGTDDNHDKNNMDGLLSNQKHIAQQHSSEAEHHSSSMYVPRLEPSGNQPGTNKSVEPNRMVPRKFHRVGQAFHTTITAEAESEVDRPLGKQTMTSQGSGSQKLSPVPQSSNINAQSSELRPQASITHDQSNASPKEQTSIDSHSIPEAASECLCPSKVCKAKGEIGFLVDASSSVPDAEFIRALQFVKALSRGFEGKESHIGLMSYGGEAKKAFDLEAPPDFQQLDALIDSASYIGGVTKTGSALLEAQTRMFANKARNDAPRALVLISSGNSIDDVTSPSSEIRDSGVKVTAVGLGKFASINELINVASEPKSEHVFTAFFERDTLPRTINGIVQAVCGDIMGELKDQTEQCTCDNNQSQSVPTAYNSPQLGPSKPTGATRNSDDKQAQPKVKYAGVSKQVQRHTAADQSEPILLSAPADSSEVKTQTNNDQLPKAPKAALPQSTLTLPEPMLPVALKEDYQTESIASVPTDAHQQTATHQQRIPYRQPVAYQHPVTHQQPMANQQPVTHQQSEFQQKPDFTATPVIPRKSNRKMKSQLTPSLTYENQDCAVNLGVLLDGSATVEGYGKGNFKKLLQFVKKLAHVFPISQSGNHLGMIVYSSEPKPIFDFQSFSDQAGVDRAIDNVSYPNKEVLTGKALKFAAEQLFSRAPSGKDVLLLITDGPSFDDVRQPAIELKRRGIEVFCIGVGQGYARNQLEMIASDPVVEHLFTAPFKDTDSILGKLRNGICSATKKTVYSTIRMPEKCVADLGFVIDGSRSIEAYGKGNFKRVLHFLKNVSLSLPISFAGTHVGAIVYATKADIVIPLSKFYTRSNLASAIQQIPFPGTSTNTSIALNVAKRLFDDSSSRRNVTKVIVVLSQGGSGEMVKKSADVLHKAGISVISVGLGPVYNRKELNDIASAPSDSHVMTVYFPQLNTKVKELADKICSAADKVQ